VEEALAGAPADDRAGDRADGRVDVPAGTLAERLRPVTLARERGLALLPALEPVVPGGVLRRGSVVGVSSPPGQGGGATSLALALAAGPSAAGSWVAAVGFPSLGLAAAAELGVAFERLVVVAPPDPGSWATVVAALVDGFDVVLVRAGRSLRPGDARRLVARARERGTVLVPVGEWRADAPDVSLVVTSSRWEGLGDGHGHLRARRVTIEVGGRREAARQRTVELWLPDGGGHVAEVLDEPVPIRRRA
jgi:hypothetical protein